jgi:hypothetical protein
LVSKYICTFLVNFSHYLVHEYICTELFLLLICINYY